MVLKGRQWGIPLEDRALLVAAYWRTNLTMRQLALLFGVSKSAADRIIDHLGPMLALHPRKQFAKNTVLSVNGTLVPNRDMPTPRSRRTIGTPPTTRLSSTPTPAWSWWSGAPAWQPQRLQGMGRVRREARSHPTPWALGQTRCLPSPPAHGAHEVGDPAVSTGPREPRGQITPRPSRGHRSPTSDDERAGGVRRAVAELGPEPTHGAPCASPDPSEGDAGRCSSRWLHPRPMRKKGGCSVTGPEHRAQPAAAPGATLRDSTLLVRRRRSCGPCPPESARCRPHRAPTQRETRRSPRNAYSS